MTWTPPDALVKAVGDAVRDALLEGETRSDAIARVAIAATPLAELVEALQEMIRYAPAHREEWLSDAAFEDFCRVINNAKAACSRANGKP